MAATTASKQQPAAVNPATRAINFAKATREKKKSLPSVTGAENTTVQFQLPKVALLGRIQLLVEATPTVAHATATSFNTVPFAPYPLLKRVMVGINNGFNPFILDGRSIRMYNMSRDNSLSGNNADPTKVNRGVSMMGTVSSAGGTQNTIRFIADLPITLNDRDPIGLILLQNEETVVTVSVDLGTVASLIAGAGYTVTPSQITITPLVQSFTIPNDPSAFPDISILKLVMSQTDFPAAAGQYTVKLPVGTTFRKLFFYIEDNNGNPAKDTDIVGDIELVFNQADIPYSIPAKFLSAQNAVQYGQSLPDGLYVLDFTYQGLANYGGARDYIDTEKLTEFWLRFNMPFAGKITTIYETISQLRAN